MQYIIGHVDVSVGVSGCIWGVAELGLSRYILETAQATPCIQPKFTLDPPDTRSQQDDQRSPALLKGVSMMCKGLYLKCIWGVFGVNAGSIKSVSSVYATPKIIMLSLGIFSRHPLLVP